MHGNGWFNDLRAEALPSARSHDGLASARTPFASSCGAWDGKAPYRFRQSCPLRRSRVRTQTCPVLRPLLARHDRQLRRMALRRIKRPEGLKECSPQDLGRVLGLDRAPEVKTLRRKLARLAAAGRAAQFGQALAQQRVTLRGAALGFLYTDGHVRVYHGKHALPKAHVARMRISMPATSDYWVNDTTGDPLFVVTAPANAGLVKMLPGLLEQIRSLVGQRRLTVVFDRGGFSPKLFQQILAAGFDLLTYRKGRHPKIPRKSFWNYR